MRVLITGITSLYLDDVLIKFETIITCFSVRCRFPPDRNVESLYDSCSRLKRWHKKSCLVLVQYESVNGTFDGRKVKQKFSFSFFLFA